jgi:integrase
LRPAKGHTLENRRDEAITRMFIDTGIRASELVGLTVENVDLKTTDALRRYLKARIQHP